MKKIMMALMLCLVSIIGLAQQDSSIYTHNYQYWRYADLDTYKNYNVMIHTNYKYDILNQNIYENVTFNSNDLVIPVSQGIYEEFKLGKSCYKAGQWTISFSVPFALAGGLLWGLGSTNDTKLAGQIITGIACTAVSISIPLLCWGDHMKREAFWKYCDKKY